MITSDRSKRYWDKKMADKWLDNRASRCLGLNISFAKNFLTPTAIFHSPWQNTFGSLPNKHDVLPIFLEIWNLTLCWLKFGYGLGDKLECLLRGSVWILVLLPYYIFEDVAVAVVLHSLSPQPWPCGLPRRPTVNSQTGRDKNTKIFHLKEQLLLHRSSVNISSPICKQSKNWPFSPNDVTCNEWLTSNKKFPVEATYYL